jgi:hypothetical protein
MSYNKTQLNDIKHKTEIKERKKGQILLCINS